MDDERVRAFEEALWKGGRDVYERGVDPECLMALPEPPFILSGRDAIEAVADTPLWENVALDDLKISRPQEGLIVLAYQAEASRGAETYRARCTSVYRRHAHQEWKVVQHQQTPAGG